MPDWSLSLAVLILGLIGLILGRIVAQSGIGSSIRRRSPWPALIAILPVMAVTLQSVGPDASDLGLGAIVGVHVLGALLAISTGSSARAAAEGVHHARSRAWSLIGSSVGVWGLAFDGRLGRIDGSVLVLLCLLYLIRMAWATRQSASDTAHLTTPARSRRRLWGSVARVCVGLTLLTMGARVLAMGARDLALVLNLDDWILGLALVAPVGVLAGWAPILFAGWRRRDGSSGQIAPSLAFDFNLINLLGLVGLTALTIPGGLPFTRETLLLSWPLVILMSILAGAALRRAEPA
ncbi:hypothetical protein [Allochromatium vinosum]|uniref:hypothetical protein n=1 Tax=Allochromatium vinosum TaxID=1049 RepID=UPI001906B92F|nr:hypothetical protein [Allochromatium vinosum]MBK1653102.1 hypothetical protein [Allochromatium vinosum]